MATVDSPLEALAFEFASFGVIAAVNNLWTWIVTAAVGFWRIKASRINDGRGCGLLEDKLKKVSSKPEIKSGSKEQELIIPVRKTEVSQPLTCSYEVTKRKLTMYYYEEDVGGDGERCDDGELTSVNDDEALGDCCGKWWERWKSVVKMRNGESWYRYVDLTVINGNVVRLWDDNGIRNGGKSF